MIAVSNCRRCEAVFSFNFRAWQPGLITLLLGLTYLLSLTSSVSMFEYDFFLYILELQPVDQELVTITSIRLAPQWNLILVYAVILVVCVHGYTRPRTTAISILTVVLILFGLLMLEVMLAVFLRLFLPLVFPALAMLLVSSIYWIAELYQGFVSEEPVQQESIALGEVRARIDKIRNNRAQQLKLEKSRPVREPGASTIGNFRLLRKIATGSTAVMYEATDMRSHNRVALKVMRIRQHEKVERDRIKHWLHEAEIVSQFDHDNIVKIHDAELLGNKAYIAMDYISGYSMSSRLRKREYLTVGECIRILKAMLRALAVAHSHGVIHGDIKPANIMYDSVHDTYILTDFGAAYSDRRARYNERKIVGTPAYMSPEQLAGKKLDGRSDLFSLAVTLYHLLSGHQPFAGNSLPELKKNIVTSEPDLNHLTLPAGITEVIVKALQKKPYMRFADAQQMLTSVEHCEKQLRERMNQHSY
jgi:tRNA A-37 threonylcarbamoyl transferase component Bud32